MQLVKVSPSFYADCKSNGTEEELLFNEQGRPCVLLLRLKYKGNYRMFVVPLRSNISKTAPKNQYFALPPNKDTKPGNHHGVHYIKLFPVSKEYVQRYEIDGNKFLLQVSSILNSNEKTIVDACQRYLEECEKGNKHPMTPDIDGILKWLHE